MPAFSQQKTYCKSISKKRMLNWKSSYDPELSKESIEKYSENLHLMEAELKKRDKLPQE